MSAIEPSRSSATQTADPSPASRSLAWNGALMCLLGLLSGFSTMFAKAPTAALSAHTIGLVQGALLLGVAGAWPVLRGSPRQLAAIRYSLLVGVYANWIGAQLAAFWSAKSMFTVTGAGMPDGAAAWMEAVVAVLLGLSALVIVACVGMLWTARAKAGR